MVWPAVIAAGSSLAGGLINSMNSASARGDQERLASEQQKLQLDFAQQGLRWRAEDAMNAYKSTGIHPLAMLGVQGPSYSPVNMVGSTDTSVGDAISNAGQGISRAMLASQTEEARAAAIAPLQKLALERGALENDLLKMRIASEGARLRQEIGPGQPGMPRVVDGQGNAPVLPYTTGIIRDTDRGGVTTNVRPGVPDVTYTHTPGGSHAVPSKEVKELIEDNFFHETMHFVRNNLLPMFGVNMQPPREARPGYKWRYHPLYGYQEYEDRLRINRGSPGRNPYGYK